MTHVVLVAMEACHMKHTLQGFTTSCASLTRVHMSSWPSANSFLLTDCVHASTVNIQTGHKQVSTSKLLLSAQTDGV